MSGDGAAATSPAGVPEVSRSTVVGLIIAIALVDVVTNAVVTSGAQLPLKLAILVALVSWAHWRARFSWDQLGFGRTALGAGFRVGAVAALVVAAVVAVAVSLPATRSFFDSASVNADSTARHVLAPLLVIPLGTVVFEETIFRGVLLAVLLARYPRRAAILGSSAVFGLWHLLPAVTAADGKSAAAAVGIVAGTIAVTTVAGVIFAWLRLRSGSVLAPVLAHVATNSLAYVGAVVVD